MKGRALLKLGALFALWFPRFPLFAETLFSAPLKVVLCLQHLIQFAKGKTNY